MRTLVLFALTLASVATLAADADAGPLRKRRAARVSADPCCPTTGVAYGGGYYGAQAGYGGIQQAGFVGGCCDGGIQHAGGPIYSGGVMPSGGFVGGYSSSGCCGSTGVHGAGYSTPISGGYSMPTGGYHQPIYSNGYSQPLYSGGYQPTYSGGYHPGITGSSYYPGTSGAYYPGTSGSYYPGTSGSYFFPSSPIHPTQPYLMPGAIPSGGSIIPGGVIPSPMPQPGK